MKTIPNVPACQNLEEIRRLTHLIEEFLHPEMIILFGQYAGMAFHDIRGGYEMLILTAKETEVTHQELAHYLNSHFSSEERREKYLSLHLLSAGFVHNQTSQSYFLTMIRKEGILLYRKTSCQLAEEGHYKPTLIYSRASGFSEQCLALGRAFREDARRQQENGIPRLAAFYLFQAMVQYIRAATMVCYGFMPEKYENLITSYQRIRYCSKEISALWEGDGSLSEYKLFGRLQAFSYKARFSYPYAIDSGLLSRCMTIVLQTEKAVEQFCCDRLCFLSQLKR